MINFFNPHFHFTQRWVECSDGGVRRNVLASRLIKNQDTALLQKRPAQTKQLPLPMRKESLVDPLVKRIFPLLDLCPNDVPNRRPLERAHNVLVGMRAQRVGVEADRVGEEEGVLGEAAEALADEGLGDAGYVDAVEEDGARGGVGHAEEGLDEGALAAAAAADEAESLGGGDGEGDVGEDGVGG